MNQTWGSDELQIALMDLFGWRYAVTWRLGLFCFFFSCEAQLEQKFILRLQNTVMFPLAPPLQQQGASLSG